MKQTFWALITVILPLAIATTGRSQGQLDGQAELLQRIDGAINSFRSGQNAGSVSNDFLECMGNNNFGGGMDESVLFQFRDVNALKRKEIIGNYIGGAGNQMMYDLRSRRVKVGIIAYGNPMTGDAPFTRRGQYLAGLQLQGVLEESIHLWEHSVGRDAALQQTPKYAKYLQETGAEFHPEAYVAAFFQERNARMPRFQLFGGKGGYATRDAFAKWLDKNGGIGMPAGSLPAGPCPGSDLNPTVRVDISKPTTYRDLKSSFGRGARELVNGPFAATQLANFATSFYPYSGEQLESLQTMSDAQDIANDLIKSNPNRTYWQAAGDYFTAVMMMSGPLMQYP